MDSFEEMTSRSQAVREGSQQSPATAWPTVLPHGFDAAPIFKALYAPSVLVSNQLVMIL